ncbi:MAG: preprotein translocase subunit SecE [Nevskia sp.]|nr:preprotein translocase subunit SecE [Nevskia sp.]
MEIQNEESGPRFDTPLLIAALLLLLGGMVSFYYFDPQLGKLARLGILLGATAAAVFAVSRTAVGATIVDYLKGANVERRKVVWPTRQESVQTTLVIAVFVVIVALIMWGLDSALLAGVQYLTGRSA